MRSHPTPLPARSSPGCVSPPPSASTSLTQSRLNVFELLLLWQAPTTAGQLLSVSLSTSKPHRAEGNLLLCLFFRHHHQTSLPHREARKFMRVKLWTLWHTGANSSPIHIQERICYTVPALHSFHRCLNIGQPSHMAVFLDKESWCFLSRNISKHCTTKWVWTCEQDSSVSVGHIYIPAWECGHDLGFKIPELSPTSEMKGGEYTVTQEADGSCQRASLWLSVENSPAQTFHRNGVSSLQPVATPFFILRSHMWFRCTSTRQLYSQRLFFQ